MVASSSSSSNPPSLSALQPTPAFLSVKDLKEDHLPLYVQFACSEREFEEGISDDETLEKPGCSPSTSDLSSKGVGSVTAFLMNKPNHFPTEKANAKKMNDKQYNEVVKFLKQNKCGVKGTSLPDYIKMIVTFASVLWEVDPHYEKLKSRGYVFSDNAKLFLNFNNPKSHGHSARNLNTSFLGQKVSELMVYIERKYMHLQHMKPLRS